MSYLGEYVLRFVGGGIVAATAACSIPTLEVAECIEARTAVREFYSFHFANDMSINPEGLEARDRFLTPGFVEKLKAEGVEGDPFTVGSGDPPRAFRPGRCQLLPDGRTAFDILVFWKDDESTKQQRITAVLKNFDNKWLIDEIEN